MAALSTPDGTPQSRTRPSAERLRLVRELGARAVPAWAALESTSDGPTRVVVVERAARRSFSDAAIAEWVRDARRQQSLEHPNIVHVREVFIRRDEVLVTSDYVDGELWSSIAHGAARTTLEIALRVLVDVLAGLSALHGLKCDGDERAPPGASRRRVHGALTPSSIVVGLDGVARILSASRPGSAAAQCRTTGAAYLAPEVLLEDESADARADVYSVGVLLWEVLSGERFLPDLPPSVVVAQLLGGRTPQVTAPPGVAWGVRLRDVVARALSTEPGKRFASAAAMAAELRAIAGLRLPGHGHVATSLGKAFGDGVRARREELEQGRERRSVTPPSAGPVDDEVPVEIDEEASQTAPTVPPPPIAVSRMPAPLPEPCTVSQAPASPVVVPPSPPVPTVPAAELALAEIPAAPGAENHAPPVAEVSERPPPPLPLAAWSAPEVTSPAPPVPPSGPTPAKTPVAFPSSTAPGPRARTRRNTLATVGLLVLMGIAWAFWPSAPAPELAATTPVVASAVPSHALGMAGPPVPTVEATTPTAQAPATPAPPDPEAQPPPEPRATTHRSVAPVQPFVHGLAPSRAPAPGGPVTPAAPARPKTPATANRRVYDPQGI